jgi:hypothetical protein
MRGTPIREAARIARALAETACLHQEPEEAARFDQIAAESEATVERLGTLEAIACRPLSRAESL